MSSEWPEYFPKTCPPEEAQDREITVYRVSLNNPPDDEDFTCNKIIEPGRNYSDECLACGLSVLGTLEDALKMQKFLIAYTKRMKKKQTHILKGTVPKGTGMTLHTPSKRTETESHMTYWVKPGVSASQFFE